jgi:hypothetical protein
MNLYSRLFPVVTVYRNHRSGTIRIVPRTGLFPMGEEQPNQPKDLPIASISISCNS